jgi:amino acid adenylation domain-containing protein
MNIHQLIDQLIKADIKFQLVENNLKLLMPKGGVDPELIKTLKLHKQEVIDFIKSSSQRDGHQEIKALAPQEYYELSHAQKRLWMLDQLSETNKTAYNISGAWNINGLIKEPFEKAISEIVKRHEILRTNFVTNRGKVEQKIHAYDAFNFKVNYEDIVTKEHKEQLVVQRLKEEGNNLFNLESEPLFRASLLKVDHQTYVFMISIHHIIADGWSLDIFFDELLLLYKAFLNDEKSSLQPLSIQYKDFAAWQNNQLNEGKLDKHRSYWLDIFKNTLPVLRLPLDFPRPAVKTFEGGSVYFELDAKTTNDVHNLIKEKGVTLFMFLTTIVKTLLYKYSKQKDIIVGTPIAGRNHAELENQIGLYINTLAFRTIIKEDETFESLLNTIKQNSLEAFKYQNYPFDSLIEDLKITRDPSRSTFFDVLIALQNTAGTDAKLFDNLSVDLLTVENNTSKFDLSFEFFEENDVISGNLEFSTDIFSEERAVQISTHFKTIIANVLKTPSIPLDDVELINEEEKGILLNKFNNTATAYPSNHTIQEIFEEQVVKNPDALAVSFEGKVLTYQELNEKSNRLAHYLRETYSIKSDDLIGVIMDRSEWLIITILGIIKSGAAYLVLDPSYPEQRISFIVEQSGIKALLLGKDIETLARVEKLKLEEIWEKVNNYPTNNLEVINKSRDLVYVIYTSGSTGVPKGVLIEHYSVLRLVINTNYIEISNTDRLLQTASTSFDASTFEIWGMLLNGGSIYIYSQETILKASSLEKRLKEDKINVLWLSSSLFNEMCDRSPIMFSELKYLLVGGEKLSPNHINKAKKVNPSLQVINGYGPTENTTFSICHLVDKKHKNNIPIGRPIANSTAYIFDERMALVPLGCVGEILVGGDGLARGYLNNEKLTNEKFIPHPFIEGERLYKTGDLGEWTLDGNMKFIGRKDAQVKIRGYRIELGEIENALQKLPGIEKSVVLAETDKNGQKLLVAYLLKGKEYKETLDFRVELGGFLPIYMIPSNFIMLEKLPLTANGKINKEGLKALKKSHFSISETKTYLAPRTEEEKKMVALWEEVLKTDSIGVKDNFFELGGHSILATLIMFGVFEKFDIKVLLRDVFSNPTIESLCGFISTKEKETIHKIQPLAKSDYYEVSYGQKRLWVLDQFKEAQAAYIVPNVWEMEGLEENLVRKTFLKLIERHEILRTTLLFVSNEVKQKIHEPKRLPFNIENIDLRGVEAQKEKSLQLVENEFSNVFDLEKGPLFRITLIQLTDTKYVFVLTMHHIISDGWSLSVLTNEFLTIYNNLKNNKETSLPPLRIQYKDYALWHNRQLEGEKMELSKAYFKELFKGELPVLELPTDYQRPKVQSYKGSIVEFTLDKEVTKNLRVICKEQEVTMFMLILAAAHVLLHKYTGQTDFIIGTPVAGREEKELENQIGFYLNNIVVRNKINPSETFQELVQEIKQTTLKAFENQFYPFDMLLSDLRKERNISRNSLFDVMVANLDNYHDQTDVNIETNDNDLKVELFEMGNDDFSKEDLRIGYAAYENNILLSFRYSVDLFKEESIHVMKETLLRILNDIIKDMYIQVEKCDNNLSKETIVPEKQTFKSNFSF